MRLNSILLLSVIISLSIASCGDGQKTIEEKPIDGNIIIDTSDTEMMEGESDNKGGDQNPKTDSKLNENEDTFLSSTFILDAKKNFAINVLSPEKYNTYLTDEGVINDISKDVYRYFNDVFDFIFVIGVEETQPDNLFFGKNFGVSRNIDGLGGAKFNNSSQFGSAGKLKSVMYMPRTVSIRRGPFLHELAHVWANYNFIPTTVRSHWGFSSAGGQLGGFDNLINLGSGKYKGTIADKDSFGTSANGGNSIPYSNLELYLMGLIPESELKSIQVAENPEPTAVPGEFTATAIKTYTPQELIKKNGQRIPSYENSQKEFKAITVVISPTTLAADKKENINQLLIDFFKKENTDNGLFNFWSATGGKAFIDIKISESDLK